MLNANIHFQMYFFSLTYVEEMFTTLALQCTTTPNRVEQRACGDESRITLQLLQDFPCYKEKQ